MSFPNLYKNARQLSDGPGDIILKKRKYNYSNEVLGSEQCSQSSLISRNSGAINLLNKIELFDYIKVY